MGGMDIKGKGFIRVSVLLLFILLVAWLVFGKRGIIHLYRMESQRQEYQGKIRRLEAENEELLAEIERLRKDKDFIESVARKELNLVKDEEVHFHFADEDGKEDERENAEKDMNPEGDSLHGE